MEQIVPCTHHLNPDYVHNLLPGYRFCPTDSEIIVYYLKRMIETGEHPECRLYEVNLYDHHPEELAELYRPCDDIWYFLTPRERKYPNGKRPNRRTRNLGLWKASQKYTKVYDDMNRGRGDMNSGRVAVGSKRSLAYFDDKGHKTKWLMHEYTINDPNSPIGSNDNKILDLVLCKIYKTIRIDNMRNQEEQSQLDNEPPPRRPRLSMNQNDNVLQRHIQTQEHLQSPNLISMQPMMTSHDSTILPQYVHNPHNNNGDIQTLVDMQSPSIQSTTTLEDDLSYYDQLIPLDVSIYDSSEVFSWEELFGSPQLHFDR